MTIKEKMLGMLNEAKTEEQNLRAAVLDGETKEERATAQEALDKVIEKIAEINGIIAELDEPAEESNEASATENNNERGINVMATMEMRNGAPAANENKEIEARAQAFADSGKMTIDAKGDNSPRSSTQ